MNLEPTLAASPDTASPDTMEAAVPAGKLGVWWFIASEIMVFGGVLASFILLRLTGPDWSGDIEHNNVLLGSINTLVLLTSSFFIVEVLAANRAGDLEKFKKYMVFTIVLGFLFMVIKGAEYTAHIQEGFLPDKSLFWAFYYGMTGLHGLHVLAGIVANISLLVVVSKPGGLARFGHRSEMCGLYWHFLDVVWIYLYPLLYLG